MQFFGAATNTGSAHNDAHLVRDFDALHGFTQFGTLITFDAAGNATGTRVVGHQYHVATGQADLSCQGRAFVATLFLIDLDDHFLAFFQDAADVDAAWTWIFDEVFPCNFL